jgi:diguanylate cyclase (GGDEF)-like protein
MIRFIFPHDRAWANTIVLLTFLLYGTGFFFLHQRVGLAVASLAAIPVAIAGWYYGTWAGILIAALTICLNVAILMLEGHPLTIIFETTGNLVGAFLLAVIAYTCGRLSKISTERRDAFQKLEQYERERQSHTNFLELLSEITARSLEADNLQTTLEILTEKIATLFSADDVFFSIWDRNREVPIPTIACGSMKDIYPFLQFTPEEITLAGSAIKAERPIPVVDIENSAYISPSVATIFPSRSMLGIPLIAQNRKLGAILLGYRKKREFDGEIVFQAGITAEQVALVLSKSLSLEEERKRVRQLTALHDVALVSIEADDEDQLIEQVVNIISQNLFTDNFGILLLDENSGVLHPHPSYRFLASDDLQIRDLQPGEGVTGEVARTGIPQRIGNVRRVENYVNVDEQVTSELCVPIKFKERILGVINAESVKRDAFSEDDERLLVTLAGQLATALEQMRKAANEHKWLEQLAHSRDLVYSIAHISTQIESSLSADEIIQSLGNELKNIGFTCIMAVHDKFQNSFSINYTSLSPDLLKIVDLGLGYSLLNYSFPYKKLDSIMKMDDAYRAAVIHDPGEEIIALFSGINPGGVAPILEKLGVIDGIEPIRLPLMFEKNLLGFLWVWGKGIDRSDLPILSILAKQIGISLERARLFQEVQNLALTDPLTGLQNRRSVFELGKIEFARAQRTERHFCCMMLDIDHFKNVNDSYGHQVGDQVLQEFARRCQRSVREVDLVGRYGGEELIIILPETDRDTAVRVAERLREAISDHPFAIPVGDVTVTVSIGVATKDEHTPHIEALIARADQALYIAKHKGRNRVAISV